MKENGFNKIELAFLGDICIENSNCNASTDTDLLKVLEKCDIVIANLEAPLLNEEKKYDAIEKTGPNLRGNNENTLNFLKSMNVKVVSLANNHIGDYGEKGVVDTIKILSAEKIASFGAGVNISNAYKPYRFQKNGIKVSVIMVCENEFGIATQDKAGAAGFDIYRLQSVILEEKLKSNHVIVFFHGGNEHNLFPSPKRQKLYRNLIDQGVSAVVSCHTHCIQGYEFYKRGVIIYGIGNGYFPNQTYWATEQYNYGMICKIKIGIKIDIELIPIRYSPLIHKLLCVKYPEKFMKFIDKISVPIKDKRTLENYFVAWSLFMGGRVYYQHMKDINNNKHELSEVLNILRCESHLELMQTYFENITNQKYFRKDYHDFVPYQLCEIPIDDIDFEEELPKPVGKAVKMILKEKIVVLFGCNVINSKVVNIVRYFGKDKCINIIDNDINKQFSMWCGKIVLPVEEYVKEHKDSYYLITSDKHAEKMREQLLNIGIDELLILV